MANKIIIFSIVSVLSLSIFTAIVQTEQIDESFNVEGFDIKLVNMETESIILFKKNGRSGEIPVSLKPPCEFVRYKGGKLQKFSYKDVGVSSIVAIFGTPLNGNKNVNKTNEKNSYCGKEIQGVVIKNNKVFLTKKVFRGFTICTNYPLDEKVFWLMAHEKEFVWPLGDLK